VCQLNPRRTFSTCKRHTDERQLSIVSQVVLWTDPETGHGTRQLQGSGGGEGAAAANLGEDPPIDADQKPHRVIPGTSFCHGIVGYGIIDDTAAQHRVSSPQVPWKARGLRVREGVLSLQDSADREEAERQCKGVSTAEGTGDRAGSSHA
jgi:hypothetical protein